MLGEFRVHLARVFGARGFDIKDVGFFLRYRAVLLTARDDKQLAGVKHYIPVAELDHQPALQHDEQLVLVFMIVPDKFTFYFGDLDVVAVVLGDDLGRELLGDQRKFLIQIDGLHWWSLCHGSSSCLERAR